MWIKLFLKAIENVRSERLGVALNTPHPPYLPLPFFFNQLRGRHVSFHVCLLTLRSHGFTHLTNTCLLSSYHATGAVQGKGYNGEQTNIVSAMMGLYSLESKINQRTTEIK